MSAIERAASVIARSEATKQSSGRYSCSRLLRFARNDGLRVISDLVKYGMASALALALDFSVLTICDRLLGFHHLAAAALGFLSGLALIYGLSVGYVFSDRRSVSSRAEVAGFVLTGLAGLALTEALMHVFVGWMGLAVPLAKIPTAGLVFLFNFTARRNLLFTRGRSA